MTVFSSVFLAHLHLCRRCAWFSPIRTGLTGGIMWSKTLQRLAVPTMSQTSLYFMNTEGHLVRPSILRAYLCPLSSYHPDAMIVSHFPHGPTLYFTLHNVTLRHDIESYRSSTVSEQYPHLIFENFSSRLGERVRDCLKYLFPVPKEDSKRVMTFSNENDLISFR